MENKKNMKSSRVKKSLFTVCSRITPRKPLYSQSIGVSEPTLPDTVTTKGNILHAVSSNCAEGKKIAKLISCNITAMTF